MPKIILPTSLVSQAKGIPALQFSQLSAVYPKDGTALNELTCLNNTHLKLRDELYHLAIPFDFVISNSDSSFHYRFTDEGIPFTKKLENEEVDIPLSYLLPLADKPEELAAFIKNHQKAIDIPSWANQELNRKIYLTRQLISPKGDGNG